jgi:CheY-like chemotaxis protein
MAGSKSILFVEDDHFISEMYSQILKQAGFELDFAYTGTTALAMAQQGSYDLILLDIMLPEMTGIEVLSKLRGPDGNGLPKTKIIVLTNLAQDAASEAAVRKQADGYLIKADVVPSKLLELIKTVI